jgi:hypothetical protein
MNKTLVIVAIVLGILFVGLAFVYWSTPASSLPSYFPGYEPGIAAVHVKHGVAALVVGLALLCFAWFKSGKKS